MRTEGSGGMGLAADIHRAAVANRVLRIDFIYKLLKD